MGSTMSARLRLGRRLGAARLVLAKRLNFAAVLQLPLDVGLEWSELVQLFKSTVCSQRSFPASSLSKRL